MLEASVSLSRREAHAARCAAKRRGALRKRPGRVRARKQTREIVASTI
jgi:hypothetical protein